MIGEVYVTLRASQTSKRGKYPAFTEYKALVNRYVKNMQLLSSRNRSIEHSISNQFEPDRASRLENKVIVISDDAGRYMRWSVTYVADEAEEVNVMNQLVDRLAGIPFVW